MTKTIEFKCPKCGFEWSHTVDKKYILPARQRCPQCKYYSDNCLKPFNAWAEFRKTK